jgi:rod shape-determining protein MreC
MTVVSPEKALVGRISEVLGGYSKVVLINSKDSNIAAILENTRIEGLVKKDERGGIFMDFIPKTEKLELKERIITSGSDNLYPKGIFIGEIETIDLSENQIFQKITIAPAVNFSKLEYVLIIK